MKKVQLSSPWESTHHMLGAFFNEDPDVRVGNINYTDMTLAIFISDVEKYLALKKVLKTHYKYGKVSLDIELICNVDVTQIKYTVPGAKKASTYNFEDGDSVSLDVSGHDGFNEDDEPIYILQKALTGNDLFDKIEVMELDDVEFDFCIFKKKVVQYFNDVLSDPHGNMSTLAQDIALEIFDVPKAIMYCTSPDD